MPSRDEIREFSLKIEEIADVYRIPCMEAIIQHCDETGIEVEVAATLISSHLKARIREEAQSANLIKKNSKLPI
jgi:Phage late-transcription coactivator